MHVTDVEVIPIAHSLPEGGGLGDARGFGRHRKTTLVRVETDDGTVGWGEGFGPGRVVAPVVDEALERYRTDT